jgi:hypothetical protein
MRISRINLAKYCKCLQTRTISLLLFPTIAPWVSKNLPHLKPHGRMHSLSLYDGKYTIWIGQGGDYKELNGKLLPTLMAPKKLDESREARLARAFSDKLPKLLPYSKHDMLTFLILEDWDISLSNSMIIKNVLFKLKKKYMDQLPYGIIQVTSYQDRIVEAWLVKEDSKWSSRIYNRGPFYEFQIPELNI